MSTATDSAKTYTKLEKLEYELLKLKKENTKFSFSPPATLKGIWKGAQVTEGDLAKAKKRLFKGLK